MRQLRQLIPGSRYHVIGRINRGEFLFNDDAFKALFLHTIKRAKNKYSFIITNFCIMGNHVHMIIRPAEGENLSRIMQWILSVFAMNYNNMNNIHGHIWYDRFKCFIIHDRENLRKVFRYISENPVKAGIVSFPVQYDWNGIVHILRENFSVVDPPPAELGDLIMELSVVC